MLKPYSCTPTRLRSAASAEAVEAAARAGAQALFRRRAGRARSCVPRAAQKSRRMANSRYEYVRTYELDDSLLPGVWLVVRVDGKGFTKCVVVFFARRRGGATAALRSPAPQRFVAPPSLLHAQPTHTRTRARTQRTTISRANTTPTNTKTSTKPNNQTGLATCTAGTSQTTSARSTSWTPPRAT